MRFERLPRLEPLSRATRRGGELALLLLGGPAFVWVFALGVGSEGGVEWYRVPQAVVMTTVMSATFGMVFVGVMRGQGVLPLVRWRQLNGGWELRFANELLGWRTVATVNSGDTIELTQRDNTPAWARFVGAVRQGSPYRRCVVQLSAPGVETEVHVALPLHRRYVEQVQQAMRADGLEVTLTFRSLVRPVSQYDAMPAD